MRKCASCEALLESRWQKKYCSNRCQIEFQHKEFVAEWKRGTAAGLEGVATKNISRYVKKYLIDTLGEKCSVCGWNKKHPESSNVPLEVDHIDGDSENNAESNLRLVCPNCHALTPNFRNRNRGKGRKWRRDRYVKNGLKPSL